MNCMLTLVALCFLSTIQSVPLEKRFEQYFYGPVYQRHEELATNMSKELLRSDQKLVKRSFQQSFNGPILNQQNVESYKLENFFGAQHHEINIDNSRSSTRPEIRRPSYKRNMPQKMEKRGFQQQFNGPILNQQNIQSYQKQDFYGDIDNQVNVDNSYDKRKRSTPNKWKRSLEQRLEKRSLEQKLEKRSLEQKLEKRGFQQQFNGPIANQQNIEKYQKQDYYGSIQTQLNVDNSNSDVAPQPAVRPNFRPDARPNVRPDVNGGYRGSGGYGQNRQNQNRNNNYRY